MCIATENRPAHRTGRRVCLYLFIWQTKTPSHRAFVNGISHLLYLELLNFRSLKSENSSCESVAQFRCLWTALTNQYSVQGEIEGRLNSENACFHSVQNLFSSSLLSKNLKIKIYRTIILRVVLYGCETWSLTLREERGLRVFENRMLRRIFGPKTAR